MTVLDELADKLLEAAEQLQRSPNAYHRAWGEHLLVDGGAILLMAVVYRPTGSSADRRLLAEKANVE